MTSLCHCEERSCKSAVVGDEAEGAPLACNLVVIKGLLRFARNDIFEPCYIINLNEYKGEQEKKSIQIYCIGISKSVRKKLKKSYKEQRSELRRTEDL